MKTKIRAAMPLLLTVLGLFLMGGLWLRRIAALGTTLAGALCAASLVLYFVWLAWESRVSAREIAHDGPDRDRGTMELAALAKYGVLFGILVPSTTPVAAIAIPGLAMMAAGIALRITAIRRMGV